MTVEEAFLAAILASPREDAPRLVFADWLEERGDPRGEFLRITVRLEVLAERASPSEMRPKLQWIREIARLQRRLRELRDVVPVSWELRLARGWIRHCGMAGWVNCPGRWELLQETGDPTLRRCGECSRNVRYCWSASDETQALRSRHPVVLALAIEREP